VTIRTLAEVEREMIMAACARVGKLKAAELLGIGKTTLYRKLHDYGEADNLPTSRDVKHEALLAQAAVLARIPVALPAARLERPAVPQVATPPKAVDRFNLPMSAAEIRERRMREERRA
jgi:hypothetical protein